MALLAGQPSNLDRIRRPSRRSTEERRNSPYLSRRKRTQAVRKRAGGAQEVEAWHVRGAHTLEMTSNLTQL